MSKKNTSQKRKTQRRKQRQLEARRAIRLAAEKLARKNYYHDLNMANLRQIFDIIEMDGRQVLLRRV